MVPVMAVQEKSPGGGQREPRGGPRGTIRSHCGVRPGRGHCHGNEGTRQRSGERRGGRRALQNAGGEELDTT